MRQNARGRDAEHPTRVTLDAEVGDDVLQGCAGRDTIAGKEERGTHVQRSAM